MSEPRKTAPLDMKDPEDRDIHGQDQKPYPKSPKGKDDLYTDGGDIDDESMHFGKDDHGDRGGLREQGLKQMSEAEYKAWLEGRTQRRH